MSLRARIEEWANAQGIDDWLQDFIDFGGGECEVMHVMMVGFEVAKIAEILRESADTPQLQKMDDSEIGSWFAENYGFYWTGSIDELVEYEEDAFVRATAYISFIHGN